MALSIVELIEAGSLDCRLAAICWVMIEHHCSVLVAASPRLAGKSTVLNALLAFLPENEVLVSIRGMEETFGFLTQTDPAHTCIVCSELSPELRFYLWGPKVLTLFETLSVGYSLGTTMHASTAEQVVGILQNELQIPTALSTRLGLVVTLGIGYLDQDIARWIRGVDTLISREDAIPAVVPIYRHDSLRAPHIHKLPDKKVADTLARKARMPVSQFIQETDQRESFLETLLAEGKKNYADVRDAVLSYVRESRR